MVNKIKTDVSIFLDGGLTFRLSRNTFLIWEPQRSQAYELLEGTLKYVGVVKSAYKHPLDRRIQHKKDSSKYFLVVDRGNGLEPKNSEYDWVSSDIYLFETPKDGNIIV